MSEKQPEQKDVPAVNVDRVVIFKMDTKTCACLCWVAFWLMLGMAWFGEPVETITESTVNQGTIEGFVCPQGERPVENVFAGGLLTMKHCEQVKR